MTPRRDATGPATCSSPCYTGLHVHTISIDHCPSANREAQRGSLTCGETSAKLLPDASRNHRFGAVSSAIPVAALVRGCSAMCIQYSVHVVSGRILRHGNGPAEGSDVDTYSSEGLLAL